MPVHMAQPGTSPGHLLSMVAVSLALHAGLAAGLWPAFAQKRVGMDEKMKVISVELVAAGAIPQRMEERPPVAEPARDVPKRERAMHRRRKPVIKKKDRPPPAASRSVALAAPVVAAPSTGIAASSSNEAETRAEGRRAYGRLVWKRLVERKPKGLHLPGTTLVNFALNGRGEIASIHVAQSSGDAELDALALRTIRAAAPFDPPPPELAPEDLAFEIPFNFR